MEPVQHFEAVEDDHAIRLAERLRDSRYAELWCVYRVVKDWKEG
jgi:hypothetical protein